MFRVWGFNLRLFGLTYVSGFSAFVGAVGVFGSLWFFSGIWVRVPGVLGLCGSLGLWGSLCKIKTYGF